MTVVNPPGVGIADDKLAHAYVEDMIRFYLDEEPVIAPARSYDLTDDDAREDALGRLGEMVVKVRDRVGGEGVLIGPEAESAREDIEAPAAGLHRPGAGRALAPPDAVRRRALAAADRPAPADRLRRRRARRRCWAG